MIRRIFRRLAPMVARLRHDDSGAMAIIMALMLTVFLSLLGVGIDVGSWYMTRRGLQTAADAAALAGALERNRGSTDAVVTAAWKEAARNGVDREAGDTVVVNNPPLSGALAGRSDAVEAIVTRRQPALFAAVLNSGPVNITSRAVAALGDIGSACVLALDGSRGSAIRGRGNPNVQMDGCMIAANSNAATSIDLGGNVSVNALSLWSAGGIVTSGSTSLKLAAPATEFAWPMPDPYANLEVGDAPPCSTLNLKKVRKIPGNTTLCGDVKLTGGQYTLGPGTIYIDGGDLELSGNTTITGTGVTIVFTNKHTKAAVGGVDVRGNVRITLSAPTAPDDPYRGVVIYQDRSASAAGINKFNGTAALDIAGAMYFPSQELEWTGNNSVADAGCVQLVALAVTFTGNAALSNKTCAAAGSAAIATSQARLSE